MTANIFDNVPANPDEARKVLEQIEGPDILPLGCWCGECQLETLL